MSEQDANEEHSATPVDPEQFDCLERASELVGVPDVFQRTWVPHRMAYVDSGEERSKPEAKCAFCEAPKKSDEDGLIVWRGEHAYVVLNLYPYNSGHLLICPYRHIATYDLANEDEVREIATFTQTAMRILSTKGRAQGFNIGMNQGNVAGAGIAAHLHQHLVPRWLGDANFMPIIGRTKPIPQLLGDQRDFLAAAWQNHDNGSNVD